MDGIVRSRLLAVMIIGLVAAPVRAEERGPSDVIIGSSPQAAAAATETCVEVEIGGERAPTLNCINHRLKQQVDRIQPSMNLAPLDAKSQDLRVGTFNESAVRQQYGQNFGRSVVPYRPPPLVFSNPLVHH